MVKLAGGTHYEPIEWDQAFALMARELNALPTPNAAAFYTSGRTSNEAAFLYQLFARQFGTNNLPDCSNMCHESSGAALNETIGVGKGCVTLEDFEKADGIFILGQNPGTNHPRMMTVLARAKENGAKIVAINPMPEPGLMEVVNPNPQEYRNPLTFAATMLFNQGYAAERSLAPDQSEWRHGGDARHHESDAGRGGTRARLRLRSPVHRTTTPPASNRSSGICAIRRGRRSSKEAD